MRTTRNFLAKQPKSLIVVGAYSIGKERVYLAISQALGVCMTVFSHGLKYPFSFSVCFLIMVICLLFCYKTLGFTLMDCLSYGIAAGEKQFYF